MARGNIAGAVQQVKAKGGSGDWGPDVSWFNLKNDNESAVVRFLMVEDDFEWAWCHEMPPQGRSKWGDPTPCLDQSGTGAVSCPGCERGMDRYFNGYVSLIWRAPDEALKTRLETDLKTTVMSAPIFGDKTLERKDGTPYTVPDRKKVVGHADGIFVWNKGIQMFEELAGKDATYKGLPNLDFVITRKGLSTDTKWRIEPLMNDEGGFDRRPLNEQELAMKAAFDKEYDLGEFTRPKTHDQFMAMLGQAPAHGQEGDVGESHAEADNPFDAVPDVSAFAQTKD